jgi:hypothetical protein
VIDAESRDFLIEMLTDLRDDLEEQVRKGGPGGPAPEKAARDRTVYAALLDALKGRGAFPDDERVREYVAGLARATDQENEYERTVLEPGARGTRRGAGRGVLSGYSPRAGPPNEVPPRALSSASLPWPWRCSAMKRLLCLTKRFARRR